MREQDVLPHAHALRASGDLIGEEAALNALLERQPRSVRGLIAKADCRARAQDESSAVLLYRKAISLGEARDDSAELAQDLAHARAALAQLRKRADDRHRARLNQRGLFADAWSPRFRQSLDIAAGRKTLYRQEPTAFTYPGLPHIQFFDPRDFEWTARIEAAAPAIRAELLALLDGGGSEDFRPYLHSGVGAVPLEGNAALDHSRDWSMLDLIENGFMQPEIIARCPRTWETILSAPVPRISGWGPTIMFSMLKAGARIAPHTGMFNTRLVCHLPLIVPPGCAFRVGNEVRAWEEGKLLIFDDTIEHEAWNEGDGDRIVLIFDIWRPELSEQERRELTALFSD